MRWPSSLPRRKLWSNRSAQRGTIKPFQRRHASALLSESTFGVHLCAHLIFLAGSCEWWGTDRWSCIPREASSAQQCQRRCVRRLARVIRGQIRVLPLVGVAPHSRLRRLCSHRLRRGKTLPCTKFCRVIYLRFRPAYTFFPISPLPGH